MKPIQHYIDHTLLHPTASPEAIKTLCDEAMTHQFYAVCVPGCYVDIAVKALANTSVKVATVVGFPLGNASIESKVAELKSYTSQGADEIDVVFNIGRFLAGDVQYVQQELSQLRAACSGVLKIIIEVCYLSISQIREATQLVLDSGADFVKTSTGFGTGGATVEAVKQMCAIAGNKLAVKASGGIRDRATAQQYIALGVSRIGTSSGVHILTNTSQAPSSY